MLTNKQTQLLHFVDSVVGFFFGISQSINSVKSEQILQVSKKFFDQTEVFISHQTNTILNNLQINIKDINRNINS